MRRIVKFFDWRFFASLAACGLIALLILSITSADASRRRASARITEGNIERRAQQGEIDLLKIQAGRNTEAIKALSEQLRQLGASPVVTTPKRTTTTTSAKKQPTQSPQSAATTTTSTTTPPNSTTTTTTRPSSTTTTTTRRCPLPVTVPTVCN